jgi:hypothetical protein
MSTGAQIDAVGALRVMSSSPSSHHVVGVRAVAVQAISITVVTLWGCHCPCGVIRVIIATSGDGGEVPAGKTHSAVRVRVPNLAPMTKPEAHPGKHCIMT